MAEKILIVSFSFEQEPDAFMALRDAGFEPVVWAADSRPDAGEEDLVAFYEAMDDEPVALVMGADVPITELFLTAAKGLKVISLNCAGYDHIDLAACRAHGVRVVNVPRRNFDAVADLAFGLILTYMRNIAKADAAIRKGLWTEGVARSMAVSGKTLGIVGMGAIGKAVAKRAVGFDMNIVAKSRSRDAYTAEKYGITYLDDDDFYQTADIIVLCCPANDETYHMINRKTLSLMKKSAVLINPSRGALIDHEALLEALQNHSIGGAALDAYEEEPLLESPLFSLDNVLLTPHIGGLADKQIHDVAVLSAVHCAESLHGTLDQQKYIC